MADWSWWLIIAIVLAGGELAVFSGFILGPLAVAAVATSAFAAFGTSVELELAVFAALSVVLITALRPIAKRHLQAPPELRTGAAALEGKEALVIESVSRDVPGLIRLENENWTAQLAPGIDAIEAGARVRVINIAGAAAIVERIHPASTESSQGDRTK